MAKENPMLGIADWLAQEARLEDAQNILKTVDKSKKSTDEDKKLAKKMANELKLKSRAKIANEVKMNVVLKKVKDLKPNEAIEKLIVIKSDDYTRIKNDIDERGVTVPIVVNEDNTVICGITRFKACRELELETIPAFEAKLDIYEDILSYAIKDNIMRRQLSFDEKVGLTSHLMREKDITLPGRPPSSGEGKRKDEAITKKTQKVVAAPKIKAEKIPVPTKTIEKAYQWVIGKDSAKDTTYPKTVGEEVTKQLELLNVKGKSISIYIRYEVRE